MAENVKYNPKLRGRLKKAGLAYVKLKNNQKRSEIKGADTLKTEMNNYYAAYESLFEEIITYYYKPSNSWELGSFDMNNGIIALNAYLTDRPHGIPQIGAVNTATPAQASPTNDTQIESSKQNMIDSLLEKTDKNAAANETDTEEGKLSPAQKKGLQDISAWFYRNVDKTGIRMGKYSLGESAYEFVNDFIMTKPARLKLMAYYLVEKKKRHNPDILDLAEAQMDYVPNLEQFKNQMIATKWKFWKRVDGSHIYWEKLGEAMRFAVNAKGLIDGLPGAGEMESVGVQPSNSSSTSTPPAGTSTAPVGQSVLAAAISTRENCRIELIRLGNEYRNANNSTQYETESKKRDELTRIANDIKTTYINMRNADRQIVSEEMIDEGVGGDSTKLQTSAEYVDKGETASVLPGTIVDKIGSNIAHLGDADENGNKGTVAKVVEKLGWNLEKYDLPVFQKINMVTSTVGGVIAFVSGVLTFIDAAKHWRSASDGEIFLNIMDTINKASAVAETIAGAALTGKIWAQGGTMTAKAVGNVLETPMAAASVATGAVGMIVAGAHIGVEGYRYADTHSVRKELNSKLKGHVSDEELETASNINDLQARIASAHAKTAAYDMASSALQTVGGILSLTGVASIAGTLVSVAGTVVSIAKSIHEYFMKKSNLESTIDAYLGIEKVEGNIIGRLKDALEQKENDYKQENNLTAKENMKGELEHKRKEIQVLENLMSRGVFRDELRVRAAAMAGYPNKQSFYEKIVGDYATFLYNKIFYDDTGHIIIKSKRDDRVRQKPEIEIYERMLKNSGLEAKYPDTENEKPKPSIQNIARKLHI